jgi:thiamine-phosphate pyrophosphorylase
MEPAKSEISIHPLDKPCGSPVASIRSKGIDMNTLSPSKVRATASERLAAARLYILIDGTADAAEFESRAMALVAAGAPVLQLRDKSLQDRELLERARTLRQITQGTLTLFIMNDRPDLAVLSDADGVHVGQEELTVADVRRVVGPNSLVGVSTHSITQARRAVADGADYLGCGPTFPSTTKTFEDFPGTRFLREVAAEVDLPAFAIGGISLGSLGEVIRTGIRRVAVSRAIVGAADPAAEVHQFLQQLGS